jgi:hypothetical protein
MGIAELHSRAGECRSVCLLRHWWQMLAGTPPRARSRDGGSVASVDRGDTLSNEVPGSSI